jgi:hypothetical protein
MKKLLVFAVVAMMFLAAGCRERIVDVPAVESLMDSLTVVAEPDDSSITFTIQGFPDDLPTGFNCVSIFLSTTDIRETAGFDIDTSTLIFSGITADETLEYTGLDNGVAYYFTGRADVAGDTFSTVGFGGMFYPRPWGQGSYLGYDPGGGDPLDSANALYFDRHTGDPVQIKYSGDTVDIYFSLEGTDFIVAPKDEENGGVAAANVGEEKWLEVQNAPDSYNASVKLELGQVYHFKTPDDYYGKLTVDTVDIANLEVKVTYAFQTAKGVQNY